MAERIEVVVAGRDKASGRHDVVLLDADAVAGDGWLERIRRCAASDARIGTIVPWSEATLAAGCADASRVSRALARAAPRVYPDIDDAQAPCIFVRGRVLREIGGRTRSATGRD